MKRTNNDKKKAFTLVELIIVMAVVAVLAAVLVPIVAGLIASANTSYDTQMVYNMNLILSITYGNSIPNSMNDIIAPMSANGYSLAGITARSKGYIIGWHQGNNEIVYISQEQYGDSYGTYAWSITAMADTTLEKDQIWLAINSDNAELAQYGFNLYLTGYVGDITDTLSTDTAKIEFASDVSVTISDTTYTDIAGIVSYDGATDTMSIIGDLEVLSDEGVKSVASMTRNEDSGEVAYTITDTITASAFEGNIAITSIVIGDDVTEIGDYAFSGCSAIANIVMSNNITYIGDGAFFGCSALTSINIPSSVVFLGVWVFEGCDNLSVIYYNGSAEEWDMLMQDCGNPELIEIVVFCDW